MIEKQYKFYLLNFIKVNIMQVSSYKKHIYLSNASHLADRPLENWLSNTFPQEYRKQTMQDKCKVVIFWPVIQSLRNILIPFVSIATSCKKYFYYLLISV